MPPLLLPGKVRLNRSRYAGRMVGIAARITLFRIYSGNSGGGGGGRRTKFIQVAAIDEWMVDGMGMSGCITMKLQ